MRSSFRRHCAQETMTQAFTTTGPLGAVSFDGSQATVRVEEAPTARSR